MRPTFPGPPGWKPGLNQGQAAMHAFPVLRSSSPVGLEQHPGGISNNGTAFSRRIDLPGFLCGERMKSAERSRVCIAQGNGPWKLYNDVDEERWCERRSRSQVPKHTGA